MCIRDSYPRVERDDSAIRAFKEDVLAHIGTAGRLVDVRSPGEYSGELTHMPDYPQEGAIRGGHVPGAVNVPWRRAVNEEDGTFKPVDELRAIYLEEQGLAPGDDVIAYCRIGERSSHTWFVLTQLLGLELRAQAQVRHLPRSAGAPGGRAARSGRAPRCPTRPMSRRSCARAPGRAAG